MRIIFNLLIIGSILLPVALTAWSLEDEPYMPFHLETTQEFLPEGQHVPVPAGFRFVLIRPMDEGLLLGDFPRRGVCAVPANLTNLEAEIRVAKANAASENVVLPPRMAFFLANRILSGESKWLDPIRYESVINYSRWLILYGNSSDITTQDVLHQANDFYSQLTPQQRAETVLVFIDPEGNKEGIAHLQQKVDPIFQAMPGYLSRGYSRSFGHLGPDEALPILVELHSTGRVIEKVIGSEAVSHWFAKNVCLKAE